MVNPATGDWLIFNGETYNFRALRAELSGPGTIFTSSGDTEILLHALFRWRERSRSLKPKPLTNDRND
jgi:asparagine synthase (glutamine-hydrolysing)